MKTYSRLRPALRLLACASPFFLLAILLAIASCGGNSTGTLGTGMASATVSLSDPPSCRAPSGNFKSVFVSIRGVEAHTSASADDNSPGWQELAPQLVSAPVQVDLLNLSPNGGACLLAILGSTSSLPAGDYQQFRLLLVANAPPSGPVPATNNCKSLGQVFNCVETSDGFHELDLSSQANTGLKVPPGQIMGGPIHVAAGQDVDINLDFNTCDSLVPEPDGNFRLRPTLTAGQISPNTTGISGQVVDSKTGNPIAGALVALEQPDAGGIDRVSMQAATDANGQFNFCPLPVAATFDVVVDAINGAVAYNATVVQNVPGGSVTGSIKLVAETGAATGPGTITGLVTAVNGMTGAMIDAAMSAFQTISLSGGGMREVTIPLEGASTPLIAITSKTPCTGGAPANAFCQTYTLIVPASNPSVDTFSNGSVSFNAPAAGDVLYTVEAQATVPMTNTAICSPSTLTTSQDSTSMPLKVTAGNTTTAKELDFSGCM